VRQSPCISGSRWDSWFRVRAVAPIAGAYDFAGAELPALLAGDLEPKASVVYTAYLLTAWNLLHGGLYGSPAEVFRWFAGLW
jgi:hypothetical protein